jgi:hypothetical protein
LAPLSRRTASAIRRERSEQSNRAHKTVGEFDGKIKYGRLLKPGQRIEDLIFEECEKTRYAISACRLCDESRRTSIALASFVNGCFGLSRETADRLGTINWHVASVAADATCQ